MNITLRAKERLFLNGAVIRVDRKTTIELTNDASFLLESHVIEADAATTPLRQIYFAVQTMLIDPASESAMRGLARKLIEQALETFHSPEIKAGLKNVEALVGRSRHFEALKTIRALYPLEQKEVEAGGRTAAA